MKNSNWIKLLLLSLSCLVSIPHTYPNTTQASTATHTPLSDQEVATLFEEALSLLNHLRSSVELSAHIVNSDKLPGVSIKKVSTALAHLNNLLLSLPRALPQGDLKRLVFLLKLENELAKHLEELINSSFKNVTIFDPALLVKRSQEDLSQISAAHLKKALAENKKRVAKIAQSASEIGLRWYNKMYRGVDRWVIQPSLKNKLPQRAAIAAGVIAAALWTWRLLDEGGFAQWCLEATDADIEKFLDTKPLILEDIGGNFHPTENTHRLLFLDQLKKDGYKPLTDLSWTGKINRWMRQSIFKLYGPLPRSAHGHPELSYREYQHLSWLGKLENGIQKINAGMYPIFAALIYFTWSGVKEELKSLQEKAVKKATQWSNYLKGGAYLKEAQKIEANLAWGTAEEVYFDDLVGVEHVKHVFKQIVDYLETPERFERMNSKPPKGILLVGDTRTGKSHSVRALFCEVQRMLKKKSASPDQFKFFSLPAAALSVARMDEILGSIQQHAPCILFIDEIDLLDLQRRGKNDVLSDFLRLMGETLQSNDPSKQVFIIAATNKPEALDKALRAPGRFGKILNFLYPSFNERAEFIQRKLERLSLLNADLIDIQKLAHLTEKKSFEDLNTIIDTAVLKAHLKKEGLSPEHIMSALDEEVRHIIKHGNQHCSPHEKKIIAAHFAGKALALELLACPFKLADVTTLPVIADIHEELAGAYLYEGRRDDPKEETRIEHGRVFTFSGTDSVDMYTQEDRINLCKYYLAGFVAEELLMGSCGYTCNQVDSNRSLMIVQPLAFKGLQVSRLPQYLQKEMFTNAMEIHAQCRTQIKELLETHKETLRNIQQALLKHETLSAQQIRAIIRGDLSLVAEPEPIVTETDDLISIDLTPIVAAQ